LLPGQLIPNKSESRTAARVAKCRIGVINVINPAQKTIPFLLKQIAGLLKERAECYRTLRSLAACKWIRLEERG